MQDIDKLIQNNTGLIYEQLRKFNLVNDPEAESIGYEALYNAILKYDSTKGTALSTVATVYIYNALGSYIRRLNGKRQIQTISYNNVAYTDDTSDHEFLELLASDTTTEDDYIHKELCSIAISTFNSAYDSLTNETHKLILSTWKDSEFLATTTDISAKTKVSQSYVSQVINNFKHCLKKKMEELI